MHRKELHGSIIDVVKVKATLEEYEKQIQRKAPVLMKPKQRVVEVDEALKSIQVLVKKEPEVYIQMGSVRASTKQKDAVDRAAKVKKEKSHGAGGRGKRGHGGDAAVGRGKRGHVGSIVRILQDDVDPVVSVTKAEKAPLESYADIGGQDGRALEIKEAVELPLAHPCAGRALEIKEAVELPLAHPCAGNRGHGGSGADRITGATHELNPTAAPYHPPPYHPGATYSPTRNVNPLQVYPPAFYPQQPPPPQAAFYSSPRQAYPPARHPQQGYPAPPQTAPYYPRYPWRPRY